MASAEVTRGGRGRQCVKVGVVAAAASASILLGFDPMTLECVGRVAPAAASVEGVSETTTTTTEAAALREAERARDRKMAERVVDAFAALSREDQVKVVEKLIFAGDAASSSSTTTTAPAIVVQTPSRVAAAGSARDRDPARDEKEEAAATAIVAERRRQLLAPLAAEAEDVTDEADAAAMVAADARDGWTDPVPSPSSSSVLSPSADGSSYRAAKDARDINRNLDGLFFGDDAEGRADDVGGAATGSEAEPSTTQSVVSGDGRADRADRFVGFGKRAGAALTGAAVRVALWFSEVAPGAFQKLWDVARDPVHTPSPPQVMAGGLAVLTGAYLVGLERSLKEENDPEEEEARIVPSREVKQPSPAERGVGAGGDDVAVSSPAPREKSADVAAVDWTTTSSPARENAPEEGDAGDTFVPVTPAQAAERGMVPTSAAKAAAAGTRSEVRMPWSRAPKRSAPAGGGGVLWSRRDDDMEDNDVTVQSTAATSVLWTRTENPTPGARDSKRRSRRRAGRGRLEADPGGAPRVASPPATRSEEDGGAIDRQESTSSDASEPGPLPLPAPLLTAVEDDNMENFRLARGGVEPPPREREAR